MMRIINPRSKCQFHTSINRLLVSPSFVKKSSPFSTVHSNYRKNSNSLTIQEIMSMADDAPLIQRGGRITTGEHGNAITRTPQEFLNKIQSGMENQIIGLLEKTSSHSLNHSESELDWLFFFNKLRSNRDRSKLKISRTMTVPNLPPADQLSNKSTWIKYLSTLLKNNYYDPSDYIDTLIGVLKLDPDILGELHLCRLIIYYYSTNLKFDQVNEILQFLKVNGISIKAKSTFNIILSIPLLRGMTYKKRNVFQETEWVNSATDESDQIISHEGVYDFLLYYLKKMNEMNVKANLTTWIIVHCLLDSFDSRIELIRKLKDTKSVDLNSRFYQETLVLYDLMNRGKLSNEKLNVSGEMSTSKLNAMLKFLVNYDLHEAADLLNTEQKKNTHHINKETLNIFTNYFTIRLDTYKLIKVVSHFEKKLNVKDGYVYINYLKVFLKSVNPGGNLQKRTKDEIKLILWLIERRKVKPNSTLKTQILRVLDLLDKDIDGVELNTEQNGILQELNTVTDELMF